MTKFSDLKLDPKVLQAIAEAAASGERVLGFPREYAADRGVPFGEVRRGRPR